MADLKEGPRKIRIGVAAESLLDVEILQNICKKLTSNLSVKLVYPASCIFTTHHDKEAGRGGIKVEHLQEIKKKFDGTQHKHLDFCLVITDHDRGKAEDPNLLIKEAQKLNLAQKILIIEPKENIEAWLLQDLATRNQIFGVKDGALTVEQKSDTKNTFNWYCGQKGIDPAKARIEFSNKINLDSIRSDDFRTFSIDFTGGVKEFFRPRPVVKKVAKSKPKRSNRKTTKKAERTITFAQAARIINLLEKTNEKLNKLLKGGGER